MSHLLEDDELVAPASRELTLGTASILAIFFGLALLCALFFGFGYNVGHKSGSLAVVPATQDTEPATVASSDTGPSPAIFSGFKPAASTGAATADTPAPVPGGAAPIASTSASLSEARPSHTTPVASPAVRAEAVPHLRAGAPHAPPSPVLQPATAAASGTFFVQVAAVSHAQDASLVVGALRAKGYTVAERSDPADKLIHLQIGPFAAKPAAEAMRQRLLGDGYNAILK